MQQPPQYYMQPQQGVVYGSPAPGQQVIVAPQPVQTNYVIQNAPPPSQEGCCSGRSQKYNGRGGLITGVLQLIVAILSVILSGASLAFSYYYYYNGYGIWAGIVFYLPAGILGIVSKNQHTAVITAYLVMSILSTLEAFSMMAYEGVAAGIHSLIYICQRSCDYTYGYQFCSNTCSYERSEVGIGIHSVLAILALVELIVAIVGAAICCGGLRCCCASPSSPSTTTTLYYGNQGQPAQGYVNQGLSAPGAPYGNQSQPAQVNPYPAKA